MLSVIITLQDNVNNLHSKQLIHLSVSHKNTDIVNAFYILRFAYKYAHYVGDPNDLHIECRNCVFKRTPQRFNEPWDCYGKQCLISDADENSLLL